MRKIAYGIRMRHAVLLSIAMASLALAASDEVPVAHVETFTSEQREHWAYQPPTRPELPDVQREEWVRNPIDRFILAGLESLEFEPAPEADRATLIRRLSFDLTGLPPTPEEVQAFLDDQAPDAYERLVDQLLQRPQFGERWAQHWLDLAHYADSNGFELDADRPDAWRYRDWVVQAINNDLPYDQFLSLQLAGDELQPGDTQALIATGFGRCGPREVVSGNIDPEFRRQSELTEVTGTVGSVFLGLTMACARCHDHKFDAIPTTDYYRLQSFFAGAQFVERPIADEDAENAYETLKKDVEERVKPFKRDMAKLEAPYRTALRERKQAALTDEERAVLAIPADDRTDLQKKMAEGANKALNITWEEVAEAVAANPADHAERERLKRAIHDIEVTLPPPPARAMALAEEEPAPPETFVLARGDVKSRGARVEPRPLGVVLANLPDSFNPEEIAGNDSTSGRRKALAEWLTRPDHPLTARVIVNRLWQHHFGRGLVATPSDFGVRGEPPSHPALLDWLATELVRNGWHLKPIHRLMVTSAAYRQACDPRHSVIRDDPAAVEQLWERFQAQAADDPDNLLVSRMNRRRLEAEALRDTMLAVTGELNLEMGGPGIRAPIEKEIEELIFTEAEVVDLWPEDPDPRQYDRRSLYLYRKRNVRYPMFDAFDAPDTQTACAVRDESTHALQSLVLVNGQFAIDRAKALAGRVLSDAPADDAQRIARLYRICLARGPRSDEMAMAQAFLEGQSAELSHRDPAELARPAGSPDSIEPAVAAAWVDLALVMLNRNEFLYIP